MYYSHMPTDANSESTHKTGIFSLYFNQYVHNCYIFYAENEYIMCTLKKGFYIA